MFRGSSSRNIDPKGRLMLPPEFREQVTAHSLEGSLVLTKFDGCVQGYPLSEWEKVEAKMAQLKNPTRKVRNFLRVFIGSAQEVTLDKQGRILVPPSLREYASLNREIALVGVGAKFEIWNKAHYEELESEDYDNVAQDIAESGVEVVF